MLAVWMKNGMAGLGVLSPRSQKITLKKKLADLECTISTMKQERINHRQQKKARDKKELACVVVVVALAMFYALFAMMNRGFV